MALYNTVLSQMTKFLPGHEFHGYASSQKIRKRVKEVFSWMKTSGPMRKLKHRTKEKIDSVFFRLTAATYPGANA